MQKGLIFALACDLFRSYDRNTSHAGRAFYVENREPSYCRQILYRYLLSGLLWFLSGVLWIWDSILPADLLTLISVVNIIPSLNFFHRKLEKDDEMARAHLQKAQATTCQLALIALPGCVCLFCLFNLLDTLAIFSFSAFTINARIMLCIVSMLNGLLHFSIGYFFLRYEKDGD